MSHITVIAKIRVMHPSKNEAGLASRIDFLNHAKLAYIPRIVENSAVPFMDAPTTSPLRTRMARKAITDVAVADSGPMRSKDNTIGIPVKSNLRKGSQGNGILNPENFRV